MNFNQHENLNEITDVEVAKSVFADLTNELDEVKTAIGRIRNLQEVLRGLGEQSQLFQMSGFVWIGLLETAAMASGLNFSMSDSDGIFPDKDFIGDGSTSVPFTPFTPFEVV